MSTSKLNSFYSVENLPKHWSRYDLERIEVTNTLRGLSSVAFSIMNSKLKRPIHQVCGPITTGGLNDPALNLREMRIAIEKLEDIEVSVFNQLPFEGKLTAYHNEWAEDHGDGEYPIPILEEFYAGFMSFPGLRTLVFLPGWQSSFGASWKFEQGRKLGKNIVLLPSDWKMMSTRDMKITLGMN